MIAPTLPSASRSSFAEFSEVLKGAPGATSVSPSKNQQTSRLMSSSGFATRPSRDIDMSAMSLVMVDSLKRWGTAADHDPATGPPEHRPGSHGIGRGWPMWAAPVADGRLREVPSDLAQPSNAAAIWFVAADDGA